MRLHPTPPGSPRSSLVYALLFAIGLVVYGGVAWDRLGHPSADPHFVLQADAWLHGKTTIDPPLLGDDWARVETVILADGSSARGRRLITRPAFRTVDGRELPISDVRSTRGKIAYMSFPPFPSVVMLPVALIAGRAGNDMIPTWLCAAAILPLALLVLRRLVAAGLSRRTLAEDLWLVAMLAFGSVLFFAAVQGQVWFTAHVIGVALALIYVWASIEAGRPVIAGLALGAASLTRTAMAFMVVLFVLEAWRIHRRASWRVLLPFFAPVVVLAIAGGAYNLARFGSPTEFGHTFLEVRQQAQIEHYGLASVHYLGRNLAVVLALFPSFVARAPYVQISGHGLALWLTTPVLIFLVWPRGKSPIRRALWLSVLVVALPSLLYQNSGWFQFGYRFSLDYMVLLVALLAVDDRPLGKLAKVLIVIGIAINLFGALTFNRDPRFYRVDGAAYNAYASRALVACHGVRDA
ncbi:MAG TPA: hypothetical protein VFP84_10400 [Kofleriaceae bacterium]|nr:hypothetical protein [Kofleriaceae bacterium]